MKKKVTALLLCVCMTAGILAGCGTDGTDKTGKTGQKEEKPDQRSAGKYIEEDGGVPLEETEEIISLLKYPDGTLEVYAEDAEGTSFSKYVSQDGTKWTKEEASWLTTIKDGKVCSMAAGQDGCTYALTVDQEETMHILKRTGAGTTEEVSVPELNQEKSLFYYFGTDLKVLENGDLVLAGISEVRIYSQADGKQIHSFRQETMSTDGKNPLDVNGMKLVLPGKENKGFAVMDTETEEEAAAMSYGAEVRYGRVILEQENDIYFLDKDGIHHMQPEGSTVETLAEGSSMMMGMPETYVQDFVKGTGDDFFALYETQDHKTAVKHYYYDKNARVGAEKTLTVYSLKENKTVRQAVSVFNQKHPEAEISYKTGEDDSTATNADKIRVLNTELLNGKGADVLILDQLPVESLMEKGVLSDMKKVLEPLIQDGSIGANFAEAAREEGGEIYGMPVRYGIPILYGTQEMIDAMGSLDTLENWLKVHEGTPLMYNYSYESYTSLLVNMYEKELFDDKGKMKEDKLKQCIFCAKEVGKRAAAEMEQRFISEEDGEEIRMDDRTWTAGNDMSILTGEGVAAAELKGVNSMIMPFGVMREKNVSPVLNKGGFVPHGTVGINSAAKEPELAAEFVKILFSKEVQGYDLGDGFPVNPGAASELAAQGLEENQDQSEGTMLEVGGTDGGETFSAGMPLKTEIEKVLEMGKGLKVPAEADSVVQEMIFQEAKAYYEGNRTLEEAVQSIRAKVDTYQAE